MTPRDGREGSTMEGAGQRSMKAAVYRRIGAATPLIGTDLIRMHFISQPRASLPGAFVRERIVVDGRRFSKREIERSWLSQCPRTNKHSRV